jgi:hypothetical protein
VATRKQSYTVATKRFGFLIAGLAMAARPLVVRPALAISAETVNYCRLMAIEAFPTDESNKASAARKAQRDNFRNCIANSMKTEAARDAATTKKSRGGSNPSGLDAGGAGVRTGQGPLSQPIPPATSTINPQQNSQGNLLRPQNMPGPAQTNPPQQPFGSK